MKLFNFLFFCLSGEEPSEIKKRGFERLFFEKKFVCFPLLDTYRDNGQIFKSLIKPYITIFERDI
jgi:hypothetical protein